MHFRNGYFYNEDGSRYIPMGQFGCYFRGYYIDEEPGGGSQHGASLIEFQRTTKTVWQKILRFYAEEDGCTMIRMFPRGDSGGSAWEGLDIGGRVNLPLLDKIRAYMEEARVYGMKLQLCLFTEPECSFYCQRDTRTYWGRRLWKPEEIQNAAPSQRRFLENTDDMVSYHDFFTDPDVRDCCHRFLDEILPLLQEMPDLFAVEVFNESGWASPHADPMNTFRWEDTPAYLDWHRDMVDHIRRTAPDLPVCISNPGVSILGHDTIHWNREIAPDFFSLHNYADICGSRPGIDYAAISDMALQYTAAIVPTMMGEWEVMHLRRPQTETDREAAMLLSRDMVWLTMLSGATGCVAWMARGNGQYHAVSDVFRRLEGRPLVRDTVLEIDITEAQAWFENLWKTGEKDCLYHDHRWCPDKTATDGMHRFCVKGESACYGKLLEAQKWSLETGIPVRFSLCGGVPLTDLTRADFAGYTPYVSPIAGYQQKAFSADNGEVRLVYLRNYVNLPVMTRDKNGDPVENFSLRSRTAVPVVLDGIEPGYRVTLLDLDTGEWTEIDTSGPVGLGVTKHDFVLVMEKRYGKPV